VALAIPTLALAAGLSFKAVHYMDSDEFCGMACHKVMEPEYTAFQRSPHARVGCAGCHIGAGAEWFVKAKISGSWQLVAVAFDLYPRPIPTPVHSLRPSSGTCEQCHWPTKFLGDRLKVRTHYAEDEANTELKTALMVKVGGKVAGQSQGIHWHVDPNHRVRYLADPTREIMYEVELTDLVEGTTRVYKGEEPAPAGTEWRTMDCVDCHNRASHIYRSPEFELDLALAGDVPHGDALDQPPVLARRVAEAGRHVHVVVDREARHPVGDGRVEEGAAADAGAGGEGCKHRADSIRGRFVLH